jgi:ketosteroid isomerase-like protein
MKNHEIDLFMNGETKIYVLKAQPMRIKKMTSAGIRSLVLAGLLFFAAHRLPAPIQEVPESPTPKPATPKVRRPSKPRPAAQVSPAPQTPSPSPQSKTGPAEVTISPADQAAITTLLSEMENRWEASVASHNVSMVDSLVADDYVSVSSAGKVLNKTELLDQLKKDTNIYESAAIENISVRAVRSDFAIVTGVTREKGKTKEGKNFNRSFRFTDTWTKNAGQWRCTNAQVVKVSEK